MGQAKNRGTFEERKCAAIAEKYRLNETYRAQREEAARKRAIEHEANVDPGPNPRVLQRRHSPLTAAIIMGAAIAASGGR